MSYSCVAKSPFDERCVARMNVSLAQMNLFAIDIIYDSESDYLKIEILLPAFRVLKHLQITISEPLATLDLTNVVLNMPSLTELYIFFKLPCIEHA